MSGAQLYLALYLSKPPWEVGLGESGGEPEVSLAFRQWELLQPKQRLEAQHCWCMPGCLGSLTGNELRDYWDGWHMKT